MQQEVVMEHSHKYAHCMKRPSWTAVFVGALVGIGIAFLLHLFAIAIGLSALKTNAGTSAIAIGGLIGIAIATLVSTFVGGWTAGYLGRPYCEKGNLGVLYGFTSWCVALLIAVLITFPMIKYVSIYSRFISNPTAVNWTPGMYHMQQPAAPASDTTTSSTSTVASPNINTLAAGAFIIFGLFFIGALASCFGGHCGMSHRCKKHACDVN